jgi:hypothetical protein
VAQLSWSTILYGYDHQVRHVRMNQSHPVQVTPSWYGDSVGHYEGDALVIDTVGIKVGPFAMVDWYGTPHTEALHVIERYRMLDYEVAKEGFERDAKERNVAQGMRNPNHRGKSLQLQFTVEDQGHDAVDRDHDLWTGLRRLGGTGLRRKHPVVLGKGRRRAAGGQSGLLRVVWRPWHSGI